MKNQQIMNSHHKTDHIIRLGNLKQGAGAWSSPQHTRVYGVYGIAPTITCYCTGPYILIEREP